MSNLTIPPSPFTATQLDRWRIRLLAERRAATADLRMTDVDMHSDTGSQPHDAGDYAQLQEGSLACHESAVDLIGQIDAALGRINLATPVPFGICVHCHAPIEWERLDLMPWTDRCAHAAASHAEDPDVSGEV